MGTGKLSHKKMAVLDSLAGGMNLVDVLEKHNVRERDFLVWMADEAFTERLGFRLEMLRMQWQVLLTQYAAVAAARLIALTEADNDETKRKACLDILKLQTLPQSQVASENEKPETAHDKPMTISEEQASRILSILARGQSDEV